MAANRDFTITAVVFSLLFIAAASNVMAQKKPLYSQYKGVTIDMTMDDARQKLGDATDKSDTEDYWEFDNNEYARVFYGPEKKVRAMSIRYDANAPAAPKAVGVFGKDVAPEPDGSIYKMVQYPDAGFWISYVRTAGDDAMVIVTMQKMDKR